MNDWIQTFTGKKFFPFEPKPEDVDILDIAHALGMLCRYNGHCKLFYSVAEHSLLVSRCVGITDNSQRLAALLHDAAEAYLNDIPRPVKPYLTQYANAEQRIESAIAEAFALPTLTKTPLIDEVDRRILCDEATIIMHPNTDEWHLRMGPPLKVTISCFSPHQAEVAFLREYTRITGHKIL